VPDDLVDQRLGLAELWGSTVDRLVEAMAGAETPERALMFLQAHLLHESRTAVPVDPLVGEAVKVLMPWHPVDIGTLATTWPSPRANATREQCPADVFPSAPRTG
jgi:hypothetical protein